MRRHTVFERLQIKREFVGIEPSLLHFHDQVGVVVDSLTPTIYLKSAVKEVKSARVWCLRWGFVRVEGTFCCRKSGYEHEIGILLGLRRSEEHTSELQSQSN